MIFRVLDCSGSESYRRRPCSFLVGETTLVDMGSAASCLTLEQQVKITDIFLSHAHLDHTKDLAFFAENIFSVISKPVRVHATEETLKKIREHLLNNILWADFSGLPGFKMTVLSYSPLSVRTPLRMNGLEVFAVPVNHPGGCEALFLSTSRGSVLYTSDTGPTEEVWEEARKRKTRLKAILLEASFPNRQEKLAQTGGHLTPRLFKNELEKIKDLEIPVFACHMKTPYQEETRKELLDLGDPRIRILEPGMEIEF